MRSRKGKEKGRRGEGKGGGGEGEGHGNYLDNEILFLSVGLDGLNGKSKRIFSF